MRVLMIHNRYRSDLPSGENRAVDVDLSLLRETDVVVESYIRDSDEIAHYGPIERFRLGFKPILHRRAVADIRDVVGHFKPHILHLHNPFPLISPALLRVATDAATVHPFTTSAESAWPAPCSGTGTSASIARIGFRGLVFSTGYRGSRMQSVPMAVSLAAHQATWRRVDRYVAVSSFVKDFLVESGVSPDQIAVRPNPAVDPGVASNDGQGVLFAGRLSVEKGIGLLLDAWRLVRSEQPLVIAGSGPLEPDVLSMAAVDRRVRFVGLVDDQLLSSLRTQTRAAVVPSIWYEAAGSVAESFAHGRPVVVTT